MGIAVNNVAAGWINTSGLFLVNNEYLSAGTRALPSCSFHNDENTGLFRQGVDTIGISASAREVVRIGGAGAAVHALMVSGFEDAGATNNVVYVNSPSDNLNSQVRVVGNNAGSLSLGNFGADAIVIGFDFDRVNTWKARSTSYAGFYKTDTQLQFLGNTGTANGSNVNLNIMGYYNLSNSGLYNNGQIIIVNSGLTVKSTILMTTSVALADGVGAQTATLTNAPAATNPTKWIPIDDNGIRRHIPAW